MRVALCLYGQKRTYAFCAPSVYRNLIEPYDPDIFLCTDDSGKEMQETYNPTTMEIYSPEEQMARIGDRINWYGDAVPNPGPYKDYPIHPKGDLMLLFKMWRCREMMREYETKHGEYDVVIGTRFDAKFLSIQPITKPEKNTIYIPRVDAFGKEAVNGIHWGMGYCMHIWWADSIIGATTLNSYSWSDECYRETGEWCGESMTKHFFDKMNINVKYTDVKFMLIRGTSERPLEGLPPWMPLSKTCFPEYLTQEWEKKIVKHVPEEQSIRKENAPW